MSGTPLVWTCPQCGRGNAAALVTCQHCGAVRTGQRAEPAPPLPRRDRPMDPPLKTDAEREAANAAARRILGLVGDLEEPA